MGFFDVEIAAAKEAIERKRPARSAGASKADKDLSNVTRGCEACSLRENWAWISSPQMAMSGNTKDPDVLALGEAPGCIHGDSLIEIAYRDKVAYPNGIPIRDLVGKSNFHVYSYDVPNQQLALGNVKRVWLSGRKPCFRVTYEWKYAKGKQVTYIQDSIIVTVNHPFLLKRYIKHDPFLGTQELTDYLSVAQGLFVGHSLQPFHRITSEEYCRVGTSNHDMRLEGRWLLENKLERVLLDNEHCHHHDENKYNESWDNLRLLGIIEHARHHTSSNNPMTKASARASHKKSMQTPEYKETMRRLRLAYLNADPNRKAAINQQLAIAGEATRFGANHKVVSVEYVGIHDVYDMEVEQYHNFAAHGVFIHNSEEDRDGLAFVGDSGKMLRRAIPGRDLDRVAFQNACRCRPKDNATPSVRDVHSCSIYLEEDILRHDFKAILGIGSVPLQRLFPGQAITRIHGTRFPVQIGSKTLWYYPVLHPSFVLRSGGDRSPAHAVFKSDIKRLFQGLDKWAPAKIIQPDPASVIVPTSFEEALAIEEQMEGIRAIDLETQLLRPYHRDSILLTGAISDGKVTIAFPIDHPEAPTDWGLSFLLYVASERQWAAHNAIMELTWLLFHAQKHNIPFEPHDFEDSMACGRLYHARETLLGMAELSRIHIGVDVKTLFRMNMRDMASEPLSNILPYNGVDAWASAIIVNKLRDKVKETNYQRLIGGIRSTAQMELMGLDVDETASLALKEQWGGKALAAQQAASMIYEVRQFEAAKQIEFNIASAQHVGDALVEFGRITLPKTGKQWNTDEDTLRNAAGDNPLAMATIDYREASKQESTYVDPIIAAIKNNIDRRLHPSYSTMLTATGRLSSESPNIQNFPKRRHRELRRQIIAPPDHLLVSFDYGQLEARLFGMASACKGLCPSIINKIDIHNKWLNRSLEVYPPYIDSLAIKTNEKDEAKIRLGGRDIIKTDFVFASFFGSPAEACANRTGMPLHIARDLLAEFWREYPGVATWIKARRQEYMDTGSVTLLTGMERHAILWLNEPLNTPIQGTAAHIVIDAQNACFALAKKYGDPYLFPRINIHDDLTFILPDDKEQLEVYVELIAEQLLAIRYPFQIVPLAVEVKIGKSWDSFDKYTLITGDYIR